MTRVQKWIAWFVAAHFCVLLLVPLLAAENPESQLPACCRRAGLHHCAMNIDLHGDGFRAHPCASFPTAKRALLTVANTSRPATSAHGVLRTFAVRTAMALRAHSRAVISEESRGPPAAELS